MTGKNGESRLLEKVAMGLITIVVGWVGIEIRAMREEVTGLKVNVAEFPPPHVRKNMEAFSERIRKLEIELARLRKK